MNRGLAEATKTKIAVLSLINSLLPGDGLKEAIDF